MCKQSLKALLVALFLPLVFWIQLADFFFRLPVCECPSALSQLNFWSSVFTVRVFFRWKHCLYLNCCFAIRDSISVWYFALRFLWDVIAHIKVSIWIYMWSFRKLQQPPRALKAINRLVHCSLPAEVSHDVAKMRGRQSAFQTSHNFSSR